MDNFTEEDQFLAESPESLGLPFDDEPNYFHPEDVQEEEFTAVQPVEESIYTDVEFKEREAGKDYIKAIIYVERDSQKGIIIGKDGKAIKRVGFIAREEIEKQTGRKVYLELRVKVMERWRKDKSKLYKLGYK